MDLISGAELIAQSLKEQGLEYCCGIIGIPVGELGSAIQDQGIKYYGYRNEQAAAYSAGVTGYLTKRPGISLSVSGPGMTNCISGIANAWSNKWPMICITGTVDANQEGTLGFQETDQIELVKTMCKYYARPNQIERIPFYVEKAVRASLYGSPGPVYLEFPGDMLAGCCKISDVVKANYVEPLPRTLADPTYIARAVETLKSAKSPLIIVGKGIAYADADVEMREFVENTNLPYLATPMGKGILPDDHPQYVGSARSLALKAADVVLLCGARLNWILHFGKFPRFRKDVKFIQIENDPTDIDNNVKSEVVLYGDAKMVLAQLNEELKSNPISFDLTSSDWAIKLNKKIEDNKVSTAKLYTTPTMPMNYYNSLSIVEKFLPKDCIIVNEGANTMDIGRTILKNYASKHRLDAGSYGTMGIGFPFALAAKAVHPEKKVVLVIGDSAFGFSAMELETAQRYGLNMTVIIINNNGIFSGVYELDHKDGNASIPVNGLSPTAKYELMGDAFGGKGYRVSTPEELEKALEEPMNEDNLSVINVLIDPAGMKKAQEFMWLTKDEKSAKL